MACAIACFRLSDGGNEALVKGTQKYERVCRRDISQRLEQATCTTDGNWSPVKSVCETAPTSLFWAPIPPAHSNLSARHYWPFKNVVVNLPIRLKGNLRCISDESGVWFHWHGGSWLEGRVYQPWGPNSAWGLALLKVEAPGHPGHPPPLSDIVA